MRDGPAYDRDQKSKVIVRHQVLLLLLITSGMGDELNFALDGKDHGCIPARSLKSNGNLQEIQNIPPNPSGHGRSWTTWIYSQWSIGCIYVPIGENRAETKKGNTYWHFSLHGIQGKKLDGASCSQVTSTFAILWNMKHHMRAETWTTANSSNQAPKNHKYAANTSFYGERHTYFHILTHS